MRSGWFWGTEQWNLYLQEYAKTRPECLSEWRSSPLANDHDFSDADFDDSDTSYVYTKHQSQVIDLRTYKWSDVRKGHKSDVKRAASHYDTWQFWDAVKFKEIHRRRFGVVRNDETFRIQDQWAKDGMAFVVAASNRKDEWVAAALWIRYQGWAYYASGPSLVGDVQSLVIHESLQHLKDLGVTLVDLGQIDGETEKERNIGKFKAGFGGEAKPFTIVRRV